jgi:predicted ATPase
MLLYAMSKGKEIDGIAFAIADQVSYDIDQLSLESPELRFGIANINELAGLKARDSSDYVRSSLYFTCAISLLPTDRWKSHYEICLRVSFLLAESANLRGESAEGILAELLEECRSFQDKLPAFYLLATSKYHHTFLTSPSLGR